MQQNVIIIGAGPAGLTAAYEIVKKRDLREKNVKVLEATNMIGGISQTVRYKGNRIDIGGHRFFSKNDEVMKWWSEVMPLQGSPSIDDELLDRKIELNANGANPNTTDRVMLFRHRVSRIFYLRKFFDYPISVCYTTFANMGLLRTMKVAFGYMKAKICKREEKSLEDFYINRFGKPLYKMFFEDYTAKVWGIHPSKLGADWGSQRIKGLSLMGILKDILTKSSKNSHSISQKTTETSLIGQFLYPKYGPGHLWETVADDIQQKGVQVTKNQVVKEIFVKENKVVSVTVDEQGIAKNYPCDTLFSSMPIKDLVAALRGIDLDENIKRIASQLPYRDFITVGLLVDKLKIKNQTRIKTWNNLVPDTWIYIQEADVKVGRLQIFNNWSPYMVEDFKNNVWMGLEYFCSESDELWQMSDEEFIKMAINELDKIQIISKEDVKDAVRIKIKKAYPAYYGTYRELDKVIDFLNGIENLYCIGRNGQHRYNNQDHSMLTAMEAVKHWAGELTDKNLIWTVNKEEEYHETAKTN
ncbi:MAG: NAD(P)/FAD-dependent oxidoreductase [Bacteroidales bacterium]|jgi:protoporphyrinogen oxidase|nr:NAD(P)/FAD-dependent oxidoreductase [Bacteroidales bacterium]